MKRFYPVFMAMKSRNVVVIGGGPVALRKISELLDHDAAVTCVAERVVPEIQALYASGRLNLSARKYKDGDLDGAFLAIAATDNRETNEMVRFEAAGKGIPINMADDTDESDFIIPSSISRDDLVIAVSTAGASPAYAARLRRRIEAMLPDNVDLVLKALRETRRLLANDDIFSNLTTERRGEILKQVVSDDSLLENLVSSYASDNLTGFLSRILER